MTEKRRKTAYLTEEFKKFNQEKIKELLGIELSEENAFTLFRVIEKIPLRFLLQLGDEDKDSSGEKSLSLSQIGKFKIRNTKAMGKKAEVCKDGIYPRYKLFPSNALEVEIENAYGINYDDNDRLYKKHKNAEDIAVEKLQKEMKKITTPDTDKGMEKLMRKVLREELKEELEKEKLAKIENDKDNVSNEDLDTELVKNEDIEKETITKKVDNPDIDAEFTGNDFDIMDVVKKEKETKEEIPKKEVVEEKNDSEESIVLDFDIDEFDDFDFED